MQFDRIADKKRLEFIVEVIRASCPPFSHVLDFGCGNGIIAKAVAIHGYKVDAVDVSAKTISAARLANPHPHIHYAALNPNNIADLPRTNYSAIICSEVLEHLQQPAELLHVLHKILAPAGVLVVTVPNGRGPRELFVTRPVQYLQQNDTHLSRLFFRLKRSLGYRGTTIQSSADDLSHIQFFTIRQLEQLAHDCGFRITTWRKTNFIEQVFPFSLLARRSMSMQRADCVVAEKLPLVLNSGFMTVWKKLSG